MARYFSAFLGNYGYTNGVGKTHRHLLDKITLLVQAETPFMDMISRAKMNTPQIEWIEEELTTGNAGDHVEYGVTFTDLANAHKSIPTLTQRTGYAEQFAKGIEVFDEQEGADKASFKSKSEMSEQEYNKMVELKTDVEAKLLQNGAGVAGTVRGSGNTDGTITTASQLTGAFEQVAAGNKLYNNATDGTTTAPTAIAGLGRFYLPNQSVATDNRDAVRLIDRLSVTLYQQGALSWKGGNGYMKDANMILLTPNNKYDMDRSLDARSNVRRDIGGDGHMLGMMFDTYKTSYGTFRVFPDRFLPGGAHGTAAPTNVNQQSRALIFNPQNWALAVNQDFKAIDIARIGLSERKMISARFGLIHRHQEASASVEGIDPRIS